MDAFIRDYRDRQSGFLDFYRNRPSLRVAIDGAALCRYQGDVKSNHQWRIPNAVLREAREAIDDRTITPCV